MLNVAPGTYVLEARYIGYATVVVQDVIVRTDQYISKYLDLDSSTFKST